MWFLSRLLTGLAVLGLIWFFWPFGTADDALTIDTPQPDRDGRLFTAPLRAPETPEQIAARETTAVPDIREETEGSKVSALQQDDGQEQKQRLEQKLFYRVKVRDGGTLQAGEAVITLEGITAQSADATCKGSDGRSWSCGTRARAALVRLIRGRAVSCAVPASDGPVALTARCTVGGKDLSEWMVRHGWATPKDPAEAPLAKAADTARANKAGIWR